MDWDKLFSPDLFIKAMIKHEEIEQYELDHNDPYGMMVTNLCHNACTWIYMRALQSPELLDNLYFITGSYSIGNVGKDHSWIEYREEGSPPVVIDLTISQFREIEDRLYVGELPSKFNEYEAIPFSAENEIKSLILSF